MKFLLSLLLFASAIPSAWAEITQAHHELTIRLNPETRELIGADTISLSGKGELVFMLGSQFSIEHLILDHHEMASTISCEHTAEDICSMRLPLGNKQTVHEIALSYKGKLNPLREAADQREALGPVQAVASKEGSYLPASGAWYPQLEINTFTYRLTLDLPKGQKGLVPGRLISEQQTNDRYRAVFDFTHPAEGIELLAGPYEIKERKLTLMESR